MKPVPAPCSIGGCDYGADAIIDEKLLCGEHAVEVMALRNRQVGSEAEGRAASGPIASPRVESAPSARLENATPAATSLSSCARSKWLAPPPSFANDDATLAVSVESERPQNASRRVLGDVGSDDRQISVESGWRGSGGRFGAAYDLCAPGAGDVVAASYPFQPTTIAPTAPLQLGGDMQEDVNMTAFRPVASVVLPNPNTGEAMALLPEPVAD